jgi:hypothetical protein
MEGCECKNADGMVQIAECEWKCANGVRMCEYGIESKAWNNANASANEGVRHGEYGCEYAVSTVTSMVRMGYEFGL